MKKTFRFTLIILSFIITLNTAFAYSGDIAINTQDIHFSTNNFLEGKTVRIYATTSNNSTTDLLGTVRFFANGNQIGGDQAISIMVDRPDDIFVDWTPTSYGSHQIAVKIYPWEPDIDNPSNNWISTDVYVVQDTDHDGNPNSTDEDDDNDGVPDTEDEFPLNPNEQYDTDGDGTGDNADDDDDNDEVPDEFDDLPLDPNETTDTDGDGIGNIGDYDDDNDTLTDNQEENLKTNPLNKDTDEDGVDDNEDAFPLDEKEWYDTDQDGIGNNKDIDDDNDGILDESDDYPLNKGPFIQLTDEDFNIQLFEEKTFDASPSYDEDGEIVSYLWEIDGLYQKEGTSLTYLFKQIGEHKIKLTIKDDQGELRSTEILAEVSNTRLYKQITISILLLLLALIIFLKYISEAKNSNEDKKANK